MYSKNLKLIFLELINTYLLLYIYCKRVETHRENHKGDTKVTRGRGRSNIPSYRPRVVNHNDLDPGRQWSNLVCSHKRRLIFFFIGMIAILLGEIPLPLTEILCIPSLTCSVTRNFQWSREIQRVKSRHNEMVVLKFNHSIVSPRGMKRRRVPL